MPQPLHILWHDDHLVAVYKPAGWLVHRTGLDAGETRFVMQTLRDQLSAYYLKRVAEARRKAATAAAATVDSTSE